MLYVVAGRLNLREFAFASLLDRPIVPVVMAILYSRNILLDSVTACAGSISETSTRGRTVSS
jgi:hypothetical protein